MCHSKTPRQEPYGALIGARILPSCIALGARGKVSKCTRGIGASRTAEPGRSLRGHPGCQPVREGVHQPSSRPRCFQLHPRRATPRRRRCRGEVDVHGPCRSPRRHDALQASQAKFEIEHAVTGHVEKLVPARGCPNRESKEAPISGRHRDQQAQFPVPHDAGHLRMCVRDHRRHTACASRVTMSMYSATWPHHGFGGRRVCKMRAGRGS